MRTRRHVPTRHGQLHALARTLVVIAAASGLATSACVSGPKDAIGATSARAAATATLTEAEVRGILAVVNTASLEELDGDAALDSRAAANLVAHRDGPDGVPGTADDNPFDDLPEIDAIPQVGARTIAALLAYAHRRGLVEEESGSGGDGGAGPEDDGGAGRRRRRDGRRRRSGRWRGRPRRR